MTPLTLAERFTGVMLDDIIIGALRQINLQDKNRILSRPLRSQFERQRAVCQ
jgi:hypothetical protein